mmetsp:Transcript_1776/g.5170  ORF Transcript_1776/g.5170 Transcript_1776/m.5170 type:complete len:339 (-) Transcript_1776:268-1284(-)
MHHRNNVALAALEAVDMRGDVEGSPKDPGWPAACHHPVSLHAFEYAHGCGRHCLDLPAKLQPVGKAVDVQARVHRLGNGLVVVKLEHFEERDEAGPEGEDVDLQGVAEVDQHVRLGLQAAHRVQAAGRHLIGAAATSEIAVQGKLVEAKSRLNDLLPRPDVEGVGDAGDLCSPLCCCLLPRVLLAIHAEATDPAKHAEAAGVRDKGAGSGARAIGPFVECGLIGDVEVVQHLTALGAAREATGVLHVGLHILVTVLAEHHGARPHCGHSGAAYALYLSLSPKVCMVRGLEPSEAKACRGRSSGWEGMEGGCVSALNGSVVGVVCTILELPFAPCSPSQ